METTVKIPNREIALAAFDRLRREQRKDAALRLAGCMLRGTYISLGIGDSSNAVIIGVGVCSHKTHGIGDIHHIAHGVVGLEGVQ